MQNNRLKELLNIIEEKVNIVDVISDYVSLEKKGQNHIGLCPFHSDSNPSMSVSESKHIFKCFSCGAGGNAISFIQNIEGITFIEAVKKLCTKFEIDYKGYITEREAKIDPLVLKGWEINKEAFNFFSYSLDNATKEVKDYLSNRGLDNEVTKEFSIGYSGDGSSLSKFLVSKGYTEEEIINNGLAKRREDTTLIDYFINRLMFAIKDINGNIIGFSGRVLEKDSQYAKYLNSPETILFKKSQILYNLDKARSFSSLKKELIIVEGFMDVIALFKSGIKNAIATMGTAFTSQHTKLISAMTKNIILAFDSDAPGINATINTGKTLLKDNYRVSVVTIPNGKDFDELFNKGKEEVVNTLNNSQSFLDFYKDKIFSLADVSDAIKRGELFEKLSEVIALFSDNKIVVSTVVNEISEKYKIDKEVINEMINSHSNNKQPIEEPYIPVQDYERNYKLKEKSNIQIENQSKNYYAKYEFLERAILSFAMKNDYAKEYLLANHMAFISDLNHKTWSNYLEKNIEDINDEIIKKNINELLNADPIVELASLAITINGIEEFKELIQKQNNNHREVSRQNLLNGLKNAKDDEEIRSISKILNDLET